VASQIEAEADGSGPSATIGSPQPVSKDMRPSLRLVPTQTVGSAFLWRWMREPLVHFLAIGGLLFAVYGVLYPSSAPRADPKRIELTVDDLRQLEIAFAAQWERAPNTEELAGLVEEHVREEVLYREALALGLDKDDTIVKRRMAQKMGFLAEDLAATRQPTTAELQAWFEKHSERFALPARATFRLLYFSPDKRGPHASDDALKALETLRGQPESSPTTAALADRFMFQDYYPDRTPDQLAKDFGPKFAQALFKLKPGSWQGPIESGLGWHLVWIESITPEHVPSFDDVKSDVRDAWAADWAAQAQQKAYETMRAQYVVVLPKSSPTDLAHLNVPPVQLPVSEEPQ
jgi:peptidyl-prolyl cis-trans isomerase C